MTKIANGIEIVPIDLDNKEMLIQCAKLYCDIWKEEPWNEDFWTEEGVIKDMKEQIGRSCSVGFFALDSGNVIGFAWGYEASKEDLRSISGKKDLDYLFEVSGNNRVFYLDEIGIGSSFRRMGIGTLFMKKMISSGKLLGMRYFIDRNNINLPGTEDFLTKLGFVNLGIADSTYPDRVYWVLDVCSGNHETLGGERL